MLTGFDEQTHILSDYELNTLLPIITQGLMQKTGRAKAVTNTSICKGLQNLGYKVNQARIRKVINHIRTHGIVIGLIATSEGYYIADTAQEIDDYLKSLKGREDAIKSVRVSLQKQRDLMYG